MQGRMYWHICVHEYAHAYEHSDHNMKKFIP
uniref:Uncharacterized protein n=1 Tax=Nelumbo nucifera TaxID=4432 RepID=A0A822XBS4_NELNU|nr:TPA_asm: hypothetical protein HUJ06_019253 [Nelumbo nucifera]